MTIVLASVLALAPPPQPQSELQNTFFLLIVLVAAVGIFLWVILARFSRPP
ncbi:MAG TPA: hypothetical protein VGR25_12530 [bacterium]|jgi:F0F1-type ATP synthase membrane subunit c/vacuolar-type H+-ATPase subunit K|nr:hypothetical protein [bacterium]